MGDSAMQKTETNQSIRARIKQELPAEIFTPKPLIALYYIPLILLVIGISTYIIQEDLAWYGGFAALLQR